MKTYKVYYHAHEIAFEADSINVDDIKVFFYKNGNLIAAIPNTCPYIVIKAQ